jgi:hypothetical protein
MLKPGKGAFIPVNEEMLDWLHATFEEIWSAAGDEGELNNLIDEGKGAQFLRHVAGSAAGWRGEEDEFGSKIYKQMPWGEGAYRVTVILDKSKKLKIDVRQWYEG